MADDRPLKDEAKARQEWRGDDPPAPSAPGHTLPASEDGDETGPDDERGSTGHPGTIPPPD